MIEKTVIDHLKGALDVPVGAQTPKGPPESYVVIERTGGGERDGLKAAVLALRCTAPSVYRASTLCSDAADAMRTLPENAENVFSARVESIYNQTDTRTKEYRYTVVFRVYYTEGAA